MSLLTIKRIGLFSGPLLGLLCYHLLPLQYSTDPGKLIEFTQAGRATLGLMAWMATWWVTEAVDIEVTALLPIAIFPLFGVAPMNKVLPPYAADVIFLFMGGFIIGLAIERWGLDRRIAFFTLKLVGAKPGAIVGGFMAVTAFLSMWVSNTACASARKERNQLMHRSQKFCPLACVCVLIFVATLGAATSPRPLRADRESLEQAAPELIQRLRSDPYNYFRFVNRSWITRVCDDFSRDLEGLPVVRLHGDAHVEQFAVTQDAWGLDDFDDSARGPAVVDIVRFLGSIDLVARQRSWEKDRDKLFDRFVEGYKRGLAQPQYLPPPPDIVGRLRAQAPATRAAFLAWGESKMQPLSDQSMKAVVAGIEAVARVVLRERPQFSPEYFRVVRAGWVQSGVGSAVIPKIMVRVRGPSDDPADDELLESKKIGDLGGLSCLRTPTVQATLRIIDGSKQLGRLKHNILAAGPELVIPEVMATGERLEDWWIRSLDRSYRQISLKDLRSIGDLAAIAYDAGVQLGTGRLQDQTLSLTEYDRKRLSVAAAKLEKRYRQEATKLVDELLLGWRDLGTR